MKNQPSSSAPGQQSQTTDFPENKSWWLAVPGLVLSQLRFGLRYFWHQISPAVLRLQPAPAVRQVHRLAPPQTVLLNRVQPLNFLIPVLAFGSLAFLVSQIVLLARSPQLVTFYSPLTELVTATAEPHSLPSPLRLTSQAQQQIAVQDLNQTLGRHLELLRQQPLHQNLLINTALIYYQLQDEENYLRYLDLAKNINPNLEVFPITVEN